MGLFDMSTLLKENTLDELVVNRPYTKGTFLFSNMEYCIESLRRFNESNINFNKELYKSLNEATSKEEENKIFGDFYNKYNKILDNYINEVRTMIDRFSINLDNLVDANDKLANDQDILSCSKEFTYSIRRYKNLTAGKYPRFNALAIYQKEFDYIGQMMEDLGPIATDIAKLEVLATVTNSFCTKMKDKWLEKCIEDITGEDDCEDLTCYAKVLNDIFVDKEEEITVNRGTIYAIREEITGYEKYKDAVLVIGDKLINDFTYISDNIGSLFYRNKDNVLSIRSENKDVSNKDYQLNTYGMNQLDIFMKSKANQVAQMCSLYVIALSVMMDNIIAHITQCGDLLDKVKDVIEEIDDQPENNPEPPTDIPEEDPELDDSEDGDINGGEEGLDDLDQEEDDPADTMYNNDDNEEESNFDLDDDEEDIEEQVPQEPEEPSEPEEVPSNEAYIDFDRENALFEYAMYAMDTVLEQEAMVHYVHKEILREDTTSPNVTGYNTDDATFIEKIVITLQNIWNKFTNLFQTKTTQRAEFINKNSATIQECNMNIGTGFKCTEYQKTNLLGELVAKPLQFESMKDDLVDENTFFKENYKSFTDKLTDGTSIKEAIKLTIIPDKEKMQTITNPKPLIEFCVNFGHQFNDIQKSIKDVKNASVMAKSIAKSVKMTNTNTNKETSSDNKAAGDAGAEAKNQNASAGNTENTNNESVRYTTHEDYLKEAVEVTKPPEGVKQQSSSDNPLKQVKNYFRVTTTVVSQRMTLSQTIFNDYFSILNGALKANGKPVYTGKKEPTGTANNTNTNNNTNDNNPS